MCFFRETGYLYILRLSIVVCCFWQLLWGLFSPFLIHSKNKTCFTDILQLLHFHEYFYSPHSYVYTIRVLYVCILLKNRAWCLFSMVCDRLCLCVLLQMADVFYDHLFPAFSHVQQYLSNQCTKFDTHW